MFSRSAHPRSAGHVFGGKALAALVRIARVGEGYLPAGLRLFALAVNIALWILLFYGASLLAGLLR